MPMHLLVVPFALALTVCGALIDLYGASAGDRALRRAAGGLLMLGAAAALVALLTGPGALPGVRARLGPFDTRPDEHAQWAAAGSWVLVGAGALRATWRARLEGSHGWMLLAAALVSALLVVLIALSGLAISHGG